MRQDKMWRFETQFKTKRTPIDGNSIETDARQIHENMCLETRHWHIMSRDSISITIKLQC